MALMSHSRIRLAGWNLQGMFRRINTTRLCKLDDEDVMALILENDLVFFVETHLNSTDAEKLSFSGFTHKYVLRPKTGKAKRNFGGISVFCRDSIKKGVTFMPVASTEYMWVKLDKMFFNLPKDWYILVCYVRPNTSSNIFDVLEADINKYNSVGKCVFFGDFNGRTKTESDSIESNLESYLELPDSFISRPFLPRNNLDTHAVDVQGTKLLDLCKSTGMRILNGRAFGDSLGSLTCFSAIGKPSTIDYFACENEIMNCVDYLSVGDPSELSDHCHISIALKTPNYRVCRQIDSGVDVDDDMFLYKWHDSRAQEFIKSLHNPSVINIISNVDVDNRSVDENLSALTDGFHAAASLANLKKIVRRRIGSKRPVRTNKKNSMWYNDVCDNYKKTLKELAKGLSRKAPDRDLLHRYRVAKKRYKQVLNEAKKAYDENILDQLCKLENRSPKAFWNLYKQLKQDPDTTRNIPIKMEEFEAHFRKLFDEPPHIDSNLRETVADRLSGETETSFKDLDVKITVSEVIAALKKLKSGKAAGMDSILNEMLKVIPNYILEAIVNLFNQILMTGKYPNAWRISTLTPVYKKKGLASNPYNYRGIAVASCFSKLFLSILRNRLQVVLSSQGFIPDNQIGFKRGCRTSDHILVLKQMIDNYLTKHSRSMLFTGFVDFKLAYDTVWRDGLLYKMLGMGVGGKVFDIFRDMFSSIIYKIKLQGEISSPINSNVGLQQGSVLSPDLFNIYLSDLPHIFDATCAPAKSFGLTTNCLMFADDLVLLSETSDGLQNCFDKLAQYCQKWGLTINMDKTKVVIFNKGGYKYKCFKFSISLSCVVGTDLIYVNNEKSRVLIEIAQSYCYLGLEFSASGSFNNAVSSLYVKAKGAYYSLIKLEAGNNIKVAMKLFDMLVLPIMTYAIEVWAPFYLKDLNHDNIVSICDKIPCEILNLKFCKFLLGVGRRSSNNAVRAEIGRYPIVIIALKRVLKFWARMYNLPESSFLKRSLPPLTEPDVNVSVSIDSTIVNWYTSMTSFLSTMGVSNYSCLQNFTMRTSLVVEVEQRYCQTWSRVVQLPGKNGTLPKLRSYTRFKQSFQFEPYLQLPKFMRRDFTKLRISNHYLNIERGRWSQIPLDQRICTRCHQNSIDDEYHFLLECVALRIPRAKYFEKLLECNGYRPTYTQESFLTLMNAQDVEIASKTCAFVRIAFDLFTFFEDFTKFINVSCYFRKSTWSSNV